MNVLRSTQQAGSSGRMMERALVPWRKRRAAQCNAVTKAQALTGVQFEVEKTSWTSRRVFASVVVAVPKGCVWDALTDYDNLGNFVPSIVENRCLERTANSAVIYQVGAQDVAMGVKFSAAVSLRCTEYPDGGVPAALMTAPPPGSKSFGGSGSSHGGSGSSSSHGGGSSSSGSSLDAGGGGGSSWVAGAGAESLFPYPATTAPGAVPSDISFELLEGDFQAFRGIWRMQQIEERATLLSYALYVKPQAWLPVALIQGRIENEVMRNLEALRQYAESQYQRQLQLQ